MNRQIQEMMTNLIRSNSWFEVSEWKSIGFLVGDNPSMSASLRWNRTTTKTYQKTIDWHFFLGILRFTGFFPFAFCNRALVLFCDFFLFRHWFRFDSVYTIHGWMNRWIRLGFSFLLFRIIGNLFIFPHSVAFSLCFLARKAPHISDFLFDANQ